MPDQPSRDQTEEHEVVYADGTRVVYRQRNTNESFRVTKADQLVLAELCQMLGMKKTDVYRRALYMFYGAMKAATGDLAQANTHQPDPELEAVLLAAMPTDGPSQIIGEGRVKKCVECGEEFTQPIRGGRPYRRCENCRAKQKGAPP